MIAGAGTARLVRMCQPKAAARALLFALLALILVSCTHYSGKTPPKVVDGVLDASGWDFAKDGPISLEGEWKVAWDALPDHDGYLAPTTELRSFHVPGRVIDQPHSASWNDGVGAATFAVTMRGFRREDALELMVALGPSTQLWCHSPGARPLLATRNGQDWHEGYESLGPYASPLPRDETVTCLLALRVPAWVVGGIWTSPRLTSASEGARLVSLHYAKFAVLDGFLVVLGLFLIVEWLLRRTEFASLFSALLALTAAGWLAGFSKLLELVGHVSYLAAIRAEFGSMALSGVWGIFAAQHLLGAAPARRRHVGAALGLTASAFCFACPPALLDRALAFGQVAVLLAVVLTTDLCVRALAGPARSRDTALVVLGLLAPAFLAVADILLARFLDLATGLSASGLAVLAFTLAIVISRKNARVRRRAENFGEATKRFVPQEFLLALGHEDVTTAKLGDVVSREVTVLFADIRNFTAMSERMSPEETFAFLNDCLSRIGPHIRSNGGFIDKYIGDAIMALFPGHPADAVRAALAMQAEITKSNARHPGRPPLTIGVGIHKGRVMMGTIGEAQRFEATVISDAVNLTARIETLTKQVGCTILISGEVAAHLSPEELQHTRNIGTFVVKGKSAPVELVEVFASDTSKLRASKLASRDRMDHMLAHYSHEELVEALTIAGELHDEDPSDGPVAWWFSRLQNELAQGGPPSGKGVVHLDEK
jgi:adenylate cyclase